MKLVMDGNSSSGTLNKTSKESSAIRKAISYADVFLPNANEARRLADEPELENAVKLLGKLCPVVVVKDGSQGSLAYRKNNIIRVPGISINPIDTTGAGDNFNAGFLCAWLDGQSIETCLKWGNITGGLSTTMLGGTTNKITLEEVKRWFVTEYSLKE
jgi:sugar/nucleoside kinase (ribokinase family)